MLRVGVRRREGRPGGRGSWEGQAMDSPGGGGALAPGTPGAFASPHAVGAEWTPETVVRGGEWLQQPPPPPPPTGAHSISARLSADSIPSQQRPASQNGREPSAEEETLCESMIAATWPGRSPQFTKALCRLMLKGQSMEYYGAAAKKSADAQGRWLQAKRAALACSQELLQKSDAGGGAGTSVAAEAWHMYVDSNSPEFRGLMTALVSLGLEFQSNEVGSAPETDDLLFFKWTRHGPAQDGFTNIIHACLLHLRLQNYIEPGGEGEGEVFSRAPNGVTALTRQAIQLEAAAKKKATPQFKEDCGTFAMTNTLRQQAQQMAASVHVSTAQAASLWRTGAHQKGKTLGVVDNVTREILVKHHPTPGIGTSPSAEMVVGLKLTGQDFSTMLDWPDLTCEQVVLLNCLMSTSPRFCADHFKDVHGRLVRYPAEVTVAAHPSKRTREDTLAHAAGPKTVRAPMHGSSSAAREKLRVPLSPLRTNAHTGSARNISNQDLKRLLGVTVQRVLKMGHCVGSVVSFLRPTGVTSAAQLKVGQGSKNELIIAVATEASPDEGQQLPIICTAPLWVLDKFDVGSGVQWGKLEPSHNDTPVPPFEFSLELNVCLERVNNIATSKLVQVWNFEDPSRIQVMFRHTRREDD